MLSRTHAVLVAVCVALIPLAPLALWVYARVASVDRAPAAAANMRLFRSLPRPPGATVQGSQTIAEYRWGNEGALVPVSRYSTLYTIVLHQARPQRRVFAFYRAALPRWHAVAGTRSLTLTRGGARLVVAPYSRLGYVLYVSQ